MKKLLIHFILCFCIVLTLHAQKINKKIIDTKTNKEILIGNCNIKGLKTDSFGLVFNNEYKYYIPDNNTITLLQSKIKKIRIEIVMGTWCGDSKEQVPRFIKILDILKYKTKKIKILCIDHFFNAENFEKGENNIQKIPTFIIYRKNKEIGRIVESPMNSLEKDLLDILNKPNQPINVSKVELK